MGASMVNCTDMSGVSVRYRGDGRRGVLRRDYRAHGGGKGGPDQAAGDDR